MLGKNGWKTAPKSLSRIIFFQSVAQRNEWIAQRSRTKVLEVLEDCCCCCIFRWFEVGCVIWAQASQIGASQIKVPKGSIFQKCVYSCLMVKMRIDLRSFGLFSFILGWGQCVRKEFVKFKFLDSWGQKVQIWKCEKMGWGCRNVSVSQKVQIFCEESMLVKCSLLYFGFEW